MLSATQQKPISTLGTQPRPSSYTACHFVTHTCCMSWSYKVRGNTCEAVRMWQSSSTVKGITCEAVRMWQSSSTVRAETGAWWALHMAMAAPERPSRQAACPELSPAAAVLGPRAIALTQPPACSSMQHMFSLQQHATHVQPAAACNTLPACGAEGWLAFVSSGAFLQPCLTAWLARLMA